MNSHLGTMSLKDISENYSPSQNLTRLVTSGLQEADYNGLLDIKLCLHYMHFRVKSSDDCDLYQRLISMNKIHLVVLSVVIDYDYVDKDDDHKVKLNNFINEVIPVHVCTQLRHLTLHRVDLGAHKLVLPDNITHIILRKVNMNGGLSVQHCTQLQHLALANLDLSEHELVLPDYLTHIDMHKVAMTGGLSIQHCTQLQDLELAYSDLGEHELVLPDNLTHIDMINLAMTGGLSVQHCT